LDHQGRVSDHDGPPPNISGEEQDDMKKFGVFGVWCATGPDADGDEHDHGADCTTKTGRVRADGPRAENLQIDFAILIADNEFKGVGHFIRSGQALACAGILCTAVKNSASKVRITIVNLIDRHRRQHQVKRSPEEANEHQGIETSLCAHHVTKAAATGTAASFELVH
jgi:hypothetical protein